MTCAGWRCQVLSAELVGEIGGADHGFDIEGAKRVHVDLFAGLHRIGGQRLDVPVGPVDGRIAVVEAARFQRGANRGDLRFVVAALVEKRVAEPRAAALAPLEPRLGLVDVRHVIGDAQFAEVRVGEAVVGDDVAGRDIGLDPLLAADAVVMPDLARHDIECRLLDAGLVEPARSGGSCARRA